MNSFLRKQKMLTYHQLGNTLQVEDKSCVTFTHNDYLGISRAPKVISACKRSLEGCGTSSRSSNIVSGYQSLHYDLEKELAAFTGFKACLLFSSGYMANLSIAQALTPANSISIHDNENHASLIDSCILARNKIKRFKHLDYDDMQSLSKLHDSTKIIVSDGVFSMSGAQANIKKIINIRNRICPDAKVVIDDTHGIGVLGANGKGILEQQNIVNCGIDVLSFGLGKAFGAQGGVVLGGQNIIDRISNHSRTYRYTTALSPLLASAIIAALNIIKDESWRRDKLNYLIRSFKKAALDTEVRVLDSDTPIQIIEYHKEDKAYKIYQQLMSRGILVHPVVYPTVPRGTSRLRVVLNINHTAHDIVKLIRAIKGCERNAV